MSSLYFQTGSDGIKIWYSIKMYIMNTGEKQKKSYINHFNVNRKIQQYNKLTLAAQTLFQKSITM